VKTLAELVPDPRNARKHGERNLQMIAGALREVGAARSIVIDESGVVLAGNGVRTAAELAGITKVKVVDAEGDELVAVRRSGLTPEQKTALALYDNRAGELSEWDPDVVKGFADSGIELGTMFTDIELRKLFGHSPTDGKTDPDVIPSVRTTSVTVGDVIQLGRHRLICGDCTNPSVLSAVLENGRADVCFTSPPYGASSAAKIRDHYVPGRKRPKSFYQSHDDRSDQWAALMSKWFAAVRPMVDAVICNVQLLADNKVGLLEFLYANRNDFCDVVIWDKGRGAPQMQPGILTNTFEFLYIFGGNASRVVPHSAFHGTVSNLVRIGPGQNEFSDVHRAVFTVELPTWVLGELCAGASTVLDPFLGTGTTMIAAEQMGRPCYGVELDPHYCQVTIDRWEAFTGQKATKAGEICPAPSRRRRR
jgi:DNA modification methylase